MDLGGVLLLPGLVNAHTHLRLTHLCGKLRPTKNFVGWLARVALRSRLSSRAALQRAIADGARQLLAGGVTAAVDIDIEALAAETLRESPLRLVFAHECISLDPNRAAQTALRMMKLLESQEEVPLRRRHGLAPHAPYSVSRELWQALAKRIAGKKAQEKRPPSPNNKPDGADTAAASTASTTFTAPMPLFLTLHLAESADEDEMFRTGRGRMVRWLRLFRVLPRNWQAPRCSPVAFLEQTGILNTAGIAAHCGCADAADAAILARRGWTVAFCPGTHEFFRRAPYPLAVLRSAGVPVCVATDSAASNTGLKMMDEMRRLAGMFPTLTVREILEMATTIPAHAMGWSADIGKIAPGYCADFSAWTPCPEASQLDRSWFADPPPQCAATIIGGEVVWKKSG
ncbi:MAG: amidohydrolase family protein [Candidatus Sumerlaeia bacterium]|nr:amidohydrolase family protein [Candidatus Sumerlaeia bacterium]